MRTKPIIVTPPNPIGVDLVISRLQQKLATLQYTNNTAQNWFESGLIFGLAQRDEKENKPIIYWKKKDYFKPFFDNYKSSCFFYETDSRQIQGDYQKFNLNLVVHFKQDQIARNLDYSIREWFINDIIKALDSELIREDFQTIQVFTDTNQVYNNYDINSLNSLFKSDSNSFRIYFRHQVEISCSGLVL